MAITLGSGNNLTQTTLVLNASNASLSLEASGASCSSAVTATSAVQTQQTTVAYTAQAPITGTVMVSSVNTPTSGCSGTSGTSGSSTTHSSSNSSITATAAVMTTTTNAPGGRAIDNAKYDKMTTAPNGDKIYWRGDKAYENSQCTVPYTGEVATTPTDNNVYIDDPNALTIDQFYETCSVNPNATATPGSRENPYSYMEALACLPAYSPESLLIGSRSQLSPVTAYVTYEGIIQRCYKGDDGQLYVVGNEFYFDSSYINKNEQYASKYGDLNQTDMQDAESILISILGKSPVKALKFAGSFTGGTAAILNIVYDIKVLVENWDKLSKQEVTDICFNLANSIVGCFGIYGAVASTIAEIVYNEIKARCGGDFY